MLTYSKNSAGALGMCPWHVHACILSGSAFCMIHIGVHEQALGWGMVPLTLGLKFQVLCHNNNYILCKCACMHIICDDAGI